MNIFNVPAHIENEAAYIRATETHIRNNARKGRARRWLATEAGRRAHDFIMGEGEFAATIDGRPVTEIEHEEMEHLVYDLGLAQIDHPRRDAAKGDFFWKMYDAVIEWGALTEGQTAAVLKMIDRAQERIERRDAAKAAQAEASNWIGQVKERRVFQLTIRHIHHMETQWGYSGIHIMEDADQNVVIYKGSAAIGDKGDTITVKATIKAHDERDGVKQTVITRPTKQ